MSDNSSVLKLSSFKKFQKGTVIAQADERLGTTMFIVLQGDVGLYQDFQKPEETLIKAYAAGTFFGEDSLFLRQPRTETVVALSDTALLVLTSKTIHELFATQPQMTFMLFEGMCKKVSTLTSEIDKLHMEVHGSAAAQSVSKSASLFPEGHGSYLLPLTNNSKDFLFEKNIDCPVCGHNFPYLLIITSKLKHAGTDRDMRVRYKEFEPMFYEVITCPNCFYSALEDMFSQANKRMGQNLQKEIAPHKLDLDIKISVARDSFSVFAGYYLAILCAPHCFDNDHLVTAGLWQRLSRIYSDVEDEAMYLYASRKCLDDYLYVYEHFNISDKQSQQLCFIIGDLHQRLGNLEEARQFFFTAKSNHAGTAVFGRQADLRLDELRELIQAQKS